MNARLNRALTTLLAAGALLVAGACSTDSPTEPLQQPSPPPGSGGSSTVWNITVTVDPSELTIGSTEPATVTFRVRRADNGQPPPTGSTMVASTSLGEFGSPGSGVQSGVLTLVNGLAQAFLFPGSFTGRGLISGRLETSVGQVFVDIVAAIEPVVADFDTANSDDNRSVQFLNTSTGNPTKFAWDFGDGRSSTVENPVHVYAQGGDYVVTLTASKTGSSDSVSKFITVEDDPVVLFITAVEPNTGPAAGGTVVTIRGTGFKQPLRVFFGSKLGKVNSVNSTRINVTTPPGDLATVACDGNGDGEANGLLVVNTPVQVEVELDDGTSESLAGAFTYLAPFGAPCVGDP